MALLAAAVLLVQLACASASLITISAGGRLKSSPQCCFGCNGCYDAANQNRYTDLTSKQNSAQAIWDKLCAPKGAGCQTVVGTKAVKNDKSLAVTSKTRLAFRGTGVNSYYGPKITLQRNSTFTLSGAGLTLYRARLDISSADTWTTLANGTFALTNSVVRAAASRLFSASFLTLTLTDADVQINNTIVSFDRSKVVLLRSLLAFGANRPTAAPKPYQGVHPLIATNSYFDLTNSVLKLINVQDAYFLYSTVKARSGAIMLINANVRFFDSVFDLSDVTITLKNSTLLLNKVKFTTDQYFTFFNGTLTGLPKPKYPAAAFTDYTVNVSGNGTLGLKATTV